MHSSDRDLRLATRRFTTWLATLIVPATAVTVVIALTAADCARAAPSVYPVGTTIYQPDAAWNGYTVLSLLRDPGVIVIDMNGHVVKQWSGFNNSAGGPARVLPNGEIIAAAGARPG